MYFQIQAIKVPVQVLMAAPMWMSARKTQVTARMRLHVQTLQGGLHANVTLDLVEMGTIVQASKFGAFERFQATLCTYHLK